MSAAAIIVAVLSGLGFLGSGFSAFLCVYMAAQGAPSSVTRFWLLLMLGSGAAGGLLGWAATS